MAIGREYSLTPSFPEETSGTFYYSITQLIDGVEVRFPYSDYGLSFDKDSGVLSEHRQNIYRHQIFISNPIMSKAGSGRPYQ